MAARPSPFLVLSSVWVPMVILLLFILMFFLFGARCLLVIS